QDGDDGGWDVPKKYENDQADDDDLRQQLLLQGFNGAMDQHGPVVGCDHLNAGRQFHFLEFVLDAVDDVQRVLAGAHDDDAADRIALAVEVGDAAADFRTKAHVTEILYQDRRSQCVMPHHDLLNVLNALGVAAAAHHVLRAAVLDDPRAHVVVAVANRLNDR